MWLGVRRSTVMKQRRSNARSRRHSSTVTKGSPASMGLPYQFPNLEASLVLNRGSYYLHTRYPDKPTWASPARLEHLRPGEWLCQVKMDGWRALVGWDGRALGVVTRNFNPIRCCPGLLADLRRLLRGLPPVSLLDAEWILPVGAPVFEDRLSVGPERLVLFDLLAFGGRWLGEEPARNRFARLEDFWAQRGRGCSRVELVRCERSGYAEMFAATTAIRGAEGIVLKHARSRYIGASDGSAINPRWLKVKWPAAAVCDTQSELAFSN
jgi:hypothetical protein